MLRIKRRVIWPVREDVIEEYKNLTEFKKANEIKLNKEDSKMFKEGKSVLTYKRGRYTALFIVV